MASDSTVGRGGRLVGAAIRIAGRWHRPILIAWLAGLGVLGAVGAPLPGLLSGGGWSVAGSDSALVEQALQTGFVARGRSSVTVVVHDDWYTRDQPGFDGRFRRVLDEIGKVESLRVSSQIGYATTTGRIQDGFVGSDRATAIELLALDVAEGDARRDLPRVQAELTQRYAAQGLEVSLVGTAPFWGEVNAVSESGLARAELITMPLILLVLLSLYGGFVAALASLSVGVTSILGSFAVLAVLARHTELSIFVQNTASMLGLGVGVDYSLFVIARFKEELARGATVDDALDATLRTSGETVVFSGITIVAAMATLFLVPLGVIGSIALGAVLVVSFATFTSVVLLPVLLRALGHRIERGRVRLPWSLTEPNAGQRWARLATRVMRRPVVFLAAGVAVMIGLAAPALGLRTFTPDAQIVPTSSPVRAGFDRMQQQFGTGATAPIRVLVIGDGPLSTPTASASVTALVADLGRLPSVARVDSPLGVLAAVSPQAPLAALDPATRARLPASEAGAVGYYVSSDARTIVLDVVPTERASADSTERLLENSRRVAAGVTLAGARVLVGGETAEGVASNEVIRDHLPRVVLAMLAAIYLLLLVTFRSILLPLKAISMNLLSVGATFGVLVLVFQHGVGAALLGVEGASPIQNFVPILLLALLFSLSTDYEVFLLGRVREIYLKTRDNTQSVAAGVASTAPLISGAALLMVVVFGSFSLAGILPMRQLGFGMAVAIALDATLVRLIIVPAAMRLMGRWNWWLPGGGHPVRHAGRHRGKAASSTRGLRRVNAPTPSGSAR
ncbi:MAG: MMPL family transporter [Dermatophilaceae bacterium]